MNAGVIEQVGTPNDLYHDPKMKFVAEFIGSPAMNFLPCRLVENAESLAVNLGDELSLPVPESRTARYKSHVGKELVFGIRPEHITEPRSEATRGCVEFEARLDVVEPMGNETTVFYTLIGVEVCARIDPSAATGPGEVIRLMANMNHMHLIDKQTDLVL